MVCLAGTSRATTLGMLADNRTITCPLKAQPVVGTTPEASFPLGLGSVANNGDLLDLVIGLGAFAGPVDLYLGFYAPALNPMAFYIFTASGGVQDVYTAGLAPWRRDVRGPVNATLFSGLRTAILPPGTYTFYLLATPADSLESWWLWSTAFNYTPAIKGVTVNPQGDLVMTAVDKNDTYYSFFGSRDENGVVNYFQRLELDQRDGSGNFTPTLAIDFDSYGRPISVTTPNTGASMMASYLSATQMKMTIKAADGTSEAVTVANPFQTIATSTSMMSMDASPKASLQSITDDNEWLVMGKIKTCKDGTKPTVNIKRLVPPLVLQSSPQLALLKTSVDPLANDPNGDYSYFYQLYGLPDYNEWYRSCVWNWLGGDIINAGGKIIGKFSGAAEKLLEYANKVYQFFSAVDQDVKSSSVKNTSVSIIENTMEVAGPLTSYLVKINDVSKLPIDAQNGPCSYKVWDYLNQIQTADELVTCWLGNTKLEQTFTPQPDYSDFTTVEAPNFDFTSTCDSSGNNGVPLLSTVDIIIPGQGTQTIEINCPIPQGAERHDFCGKVSGTNEPFFGIFFRLNHGFVGPKYQFDSCEEGARSYDLRNPHLKNFACYAQNHYHGWDIEYENGVITTITHWKHGLRDGHSYDLRADGKTVKIDWVYRDGNLVSHIDYQENGYMQTCDDLTFKCSWSQWK